MKRYYFAHPVTDYGTPRQKRVIKSLESLGWEVESPDTPEHDAGYRAQGMDYFMNVIASCDGLAYMPFADGKVGAGVAKEIACAVRLGKPVFMVSQNGRMLMTHKLDDWERHVMTIDETRQRIKDIRAERMSKDHH